MKNGFYREGYVEMIDELNESFSLEQPSFVGEKISKRVYCIIWFNSSYEKLIIFIR